MASKTMEKCGGFKLYSRLDFVHHCLLLVCLIILTSAASAIQIIHENGRNITHPYHESAKINFSQRSVLDTDNNVKVDDNYNSNNNNNVESNSYLDQLVGIYRRIANHIRDKRQSCGTFDLGCLLRHSKKGTPVAADTVIVPKPSGFIDIDNAFDGDLTPLRKVRSVKSRKTKAIKGTNDDEDYDASGEIAEGSGEVHEGDKKQPSHIIPSYTTSTGSPPLPGQPHYYRVVLKVNEPYRDEYQDRSSTEYQNFQQSLVQAIEQLYEPVEGRQSVNVVNIQKNNDQFFFTVTLDIGTLDFYDTDVIEDVLKRHIRDTHRLGPIMVTDDEFSFRDFGVSPTPYGRNCQPHQLPCRSGECLDPQKRCDGFNDCLDGSDELGCAAATTSTTSADIDGEQTSTTPDGVPDRCRADDKVRCPDGTAYICTDQVCDGHSDCNDGWDESNCTKTTECTDGEFICDVTRCIPLSKKCDNYYDCTDKTDERDCEAQCTPEQFRCKSGKCIEHFRRCDHVMDCPEGEDEYDCNCSPDEFTCSDGICIDARQKCDGRNDCYDNSDEADCPTTPPPFAGCRPDEFTCEYGGCIDVRLRCDGQRDCPNDESDEWNCPTVPESTTCRPDEFTCDYGGCIDHRERCDGKRDCPNDDSDERNCVGVCSVEEFKCRDGTCIPNTQHCDKIPHCPDKSDEQTCPCLPGEFQCANGFCIPETRRCDKYNHCQDGSDEADCKISCASEEFKCHDESRCVPSSRVCDGFPDCSDQSDESNCSAPPTCSSSEFRCNDGTCVSIDKRCNGVNECREGEDERNCPVPSTCAPHQFQCTNGMCIDNYKKCDGVPDCSDRSDEASCGAGVPLCPTNYWTCKHTFDCVPKASRCNGILDCRDGSDEQGCQEEMPPCQDFDFNCADGGCIPLKFYCDGREQCDDASDELNCPVVDTTTRPPCSNSEFTCQDGTCIPSIYVCDSVPDCPDKSDESNCPVSCASDDVVCGDGRCLSPTKKCDRQIDCVDGADERDCGLCAEGDFRCDDGTCVASSKRCDGRHDCRDGSDEIHCVETCKSKQWRCKISGLCISLKRRCDRREDCPDGSDEQNCTNAFSCKPGHFQCNNGFCIPNIYICDNYSDCTDGSDEAHCTTPQGCSDNEFTCGDGSCVPNSARCNQAYECSDRSDEANCFAPDLRLCSHDEFQCEDGQCIEKRRKCDGAYDCRDGSDERKCRDCFPTEWSCDLGSCINLKHRCDNIYDCRDFSDEQNCVGCESYEFTCKSGDCIPNYAMCDGRRDCPDGSDEDSCYASSGSSTPRQPVSCNFGQFACHSGDQCVPQSSRCDGHYQCRDGSDETSCGNGPCSPHEFRCENGPCIPLNLRCNGRNDCPYDISDELDCPPRPPGRDELKLVTYPSSQIIKEGREVVFQCRDEGPLRARVKWLRDGIPLPPGSVDHNGRLEIPNIQRSQAGTYVCEAPDFPSSTQGQRVNVVLTVEPFNEPSSRQPACKSHEATCSNGECIDKSQVCDGRHDCTDGSDELRCRLKGCEPNEFRCNNKKCVSKAWRCDFDDDCGDGSDEENCHIVSPGGVCQPKEFACRSGTQCIPKSYECDGEFDCQDGSDESQCSKPKVIIPPPAEVRLDCKAGMTFMINCTAIGGPVPEISWRRNWGHVPSKCTQTSKDGFGILTCTDIREEDQGAYSCEALNTRGVDFAVPDTNLQCTDQPASRVCPLGTFNSEAQRREECLNCFGFGKALSCKSADLFIYEIPAPLTQYKLIGVKTSPDGTIEIRPHVTFRSMGPNIRPVVNGFQLYSRATPDESEFGEHVIPYFVMPDAFRGNQLKSYGGHFKYTLKYDGNGRPIIAPDVVIVGRSGSVIVYSPESPHFSGRGDGEDIAIRFWPGQWKKQTPRGDFSAIREDIMDVLADIDSILIRAQYLDGDVLDTTVSNVRLESSGPRNSGLGKSVFVEQCQCPVGYVGLSCEDCAPGYERRPGTDKWRGECTREIVKCPAGTYGDPARNIPCQICPCPLTNPSNQFGRTCHLDSDGQVTCDCPPGYIGRRCERCDSGFAGNPNIPGDSCKSEICDPNGSISPLPNPNTGLCECKDFAIGTTCNQCKANTFHLSAQNIHGCISCFCSGVTEQCDSSRWYRQQIQASFARDTQGFKLQEYSTGAFVDSGIHFDATERELVYQDFNRRAPEVYYWVLPPAFLGNKVTSYGGYLNYTVRFSTVEGGGISKNNAPDVELISDNDIRLLYFNPNERLEVNVPQTVSVRLLEQYWQRHDGQPANREHLIMALADLKSILIKATYTTITKQASLSRVSLDIAEERNTGQNRAVEVEHCQCPVGYRGLSCEDCDVGYTRTEEGLYLGTCEPCSCNGHSNECDPETGTCINCRQGTTGENCDQCQPGFSGDPLSSEGCYRSGESSSCNCDPRGSFRSDCPGGQCVCKNNVEGPNCDQCKPGSFGLSEQNVEGCHKCFCSGITEDCQSSNLYITQIPMQILDNVDNQFTLTDSSRRNAIRSGFTLNSAENEIGYIFPPGRTQHLFWTLPSVFTGNKIASYGGQLTLSQRFETTYASSPSTDKDIIFIGNGMTIFWNNPDQVISNSTQVISVPLHEKDWQRLDSSGIRPASRSDLMSVLLNLEAILVLATPYTQLHSTYLSDIAMDTAVSHFSGDERKATDVEVCRCPPGYSGMSCEVCQPGYYRDIYDRSSPSAFGICKVCPCNNHEESCVLEGDGRVLCSCKQGYTGRYCEMPERPGMLKIMITPTRVENKPVGFEQSFVCEYESSEEMTIKFSLPETSTKQTYLHIIKEESFEINAYGGQRKMTVRLYPDIRLVDCIVYNRDGVEVGKVTAMIEGTENQERYPDSPRPPAPPSRLEISISEPVIQIVQVGSTARFRCTGRSLEPGRVVTTRWSKEDGELPEGRYIEDRDGMLVIHTVQVSDSGTYVCVVSDGFSVATERATLNVGGSPHSRPQVSIQPRFVEVREGEPVEIRCTATGNPAPTLRWDSAHGAPLSPEITFYDGVFYIPRVRLSDAGNYICTATNFAGQDAQEAMLIVRERERGPQGPLEPAVRVSVSPNEYSGPPRETVTFYCQGPPGYSLRWSRENRELPPQANQRDGVLSIYDVSPSDSGNYICAAFDPSGRPTGEAVARVSVMSVGAPPTVQIDPEKITVPQGTMVELRCDAKGEPQPKVRWTRVGQDLGDNAREYGSLLRIENVMMKDRGTYLCIADSPTGSAQASAFVDVERREAPGVELYPSASQTVHEGGSLILQCRITKGDPPPQIRWSKSDGRSFGSNIEELNNGVLRFSNVKLEDAGQFICRAENSAGSVDAIATIEVHSRPVITVTPSTDLTVVEGQRVKLECRATGSPPPSVSWSKTNYRDHPYSVGITEGQPMSAIHEITSVTKADEGSYSCIAINAAGTSEERVMLQVEVDNNIGPTRGDIPGGGEDPYGRPRYPYQPESHRPYPDDRREPYRPDDRRDPYRPDDRRDPYHPDDRRDPYHPDDRRDPYHPDDRRDPYHPDDRRDPHRPDDRRDPYHPDDRRDPYHPDDRRDPHRPVDGRDPYQPDDRRDPYRPDNHQDRYQPEAHRPDDRRDPYQPEPSRGARPPYPAENVYSVPVGGMAELRCLVKRLGPGEFLDWIRSNNVPLPPGSRVKNGTLFIENVQPDSAGEYQCIGLNNLGQLLFTNKATLVVVDVPPRITLEPIRQIVRLGSNAYVTCSATGEQPINIEWSAVNRRLPDSAYVNGGVLHFRSISVNDAGKYLCRASNYAGEAEAISEVIVLEGDEEAPGPESASTIMAAESDVTARVGSSATLSCYVSADASGLQPPVYWTREGGHPLPPNAFPRGEVLQLTNISPADEGRYVCQIETPTGPVSDVVLLRLDRSGERCQHSREFECVESRECIPVHSVCDGVVDCRDQSDERYCRRGRETPNAFLKVESSTSNPKLGDILELRCIVSDGVPPSSLVWTKVDSPFAENVQIFGDVLRINEVKEENNGIYRCRGPPGVRHEDYVVSVERGPEGNEMSEGEIKTSPYGKQVELDCKTDLNPPVSYSWKKLNGELPADSYIKERSLVVNDVKAQDAGTYVCTAQNAQTQVDVPVTLVVTGVVPYFAQAPSSYMVLPTLPDAYLQFDIEVSFKPESPNGLILYNGQQKGGSGDFVSLGLNEGFVEFRFDVGSGTAIIRNNRPVSLGQWHTVKISRSRKDGIMFVDGEGPFTGSAAGTFQGLDLVEPLYVGGVPNFKNVHKSIGQTKGLVGCISRLRISSTEHDLVKDATYSSGITTCETCADNPCRNKGICQEAPMKQGYICLCPPGFNGQNCDKLGENCFPGACGEGKCTYRDEGLHCKCPLGKEGKRCERSVDVIEPFFANDAYIAYPTPKALRKLKVSIKLKPKDFSDGVFMYIANDEDGLRDFVSLAMKDQGIEFRYNNDSGPTLLRVDNFFREDEWITVNANRDFREGRLIVKAGENEREISDTISRNPMLNLRTPLYIGGYDKEKIRISPYVGVENGFHGCITDVEVSGLDLNLKNSAIDSANVGNCPAMSVRTSASGLLNAGHRQVVSPCASHNPCMNGGMCYPQGDNYSCVCPEGYSGKHCEIQTGLCFLLKPCKNSGICTGTDSTYNCRCAFGFAGPTCEEKLDVTARIAFQGDGYVELRQDLAAEKSLEANNIVIEFSTNEDGLIYWHGQEAHQNGRGQDYLAVAVVDGYLEMSYELGSGPVHIRSDRRVDDGKKHRVVLTRTARRGTLEVDDDGSIKVAESGGHLTSLNAAGNIYIGGVPDFGRMTSGFYSRGFNGCIHSLTIGGTSVNFNNTVLSSRNVHECSSAPEDDEDENYDEFVN